MTFTVLRGHCIDQLRMLRDESVHCVVTSIPYWGLRDYQVPPVVWGGDDDCDHQWEPWSPKPETFAGQVRFVASSVDDCRETAKRSTAGFAKDGGHGTSVCQCCGAIKCSIGLEPTYQMFIHHITLVFREVWRVLRRDGTCWINIGDCYATAAGASGGNPGGGDHGSKWAGRPILGQSSWMNGRKLAKLSNHAPSSSSTLRGNGHVGGGPKFDQLRTGDTGTSSARPAMGMHIPSAKKSGAEPGEGYGPKQQPNRMPQHGLKAKDKVNIPHRVAMALQDDGWWWRDEIIWHKPNPMPSSVRDRTTNAHEFIFMFAKSGRTLLWNHHRDNRWTWTRPEPDYIWRNRKTRVETTEPQGEGWARINLWRGFDYYFDQKAIAERASSNSHARMAKMPDGWDTGAGGHGAYHRNGREKGETFRAPGVTPKSAPNDSMIRAKESWHESTTSVLDTRNMRSVWTVATEAYAESHFATFPTALIKPCILAGCPPGGVCKNCGAPIPKEIIDAVRMPILSKSIQSTSISERPKEVLQRTVLSCSDEKDTASDNVCAVQEPISVNQNGEVLQQEMRINEHSENTSHYKGQIHHVEGLRGDISAEPPISVQGRVCNGTSVGDGEADRAPPSAERGGTPSGHQPTKQYVEQSGIDVQGRARPPSKRKNRRDRVPPLRCTDSLVTACPNCCADLTQVGAIGPGTVLDCFGGAGTTAVVAQRLGRDSILIELSDKYATMAERRIRKDVPPLLHEIEGITPDEQAGLFDQAAK